MHCEGLEAVSTQKVVSDVVPDRQSANIVPRHENVVDERVKVLRVIQDLAVVDNRSKIVKGCWFSIAIPI